MAFGLGYILHTNVWNVLQKLTEAFTLPWLRNTIMKKSPQQLWLEVSYFLNKQMKVLQKTFKVI